MHSFYLTRIFRQENPLESRILSRIRTGTQTDMDLEEINKRVLPQPHNALILTPFTATRDWDNQVGLGAIQTRRLFEFHSTRTGTMRKKKFKGIPDVLMLKMGCRVVIKNNMNYKVKGIEQRVVNGETGTFQGVDKYERLIILRDRDQEHVYVKAKKFEDIKHEVIETDEGKEIIDKKTGFFKQYPIDLAYAMTFHGAQGSTLDRVHIDLPPPGNSFMRKTPGLLYVGLSRVRAFKDLTLSRPLLHSDIVVSSAVKRDEEIQGEL